MFLTTLFPISNIFLAIVDNTANILYYQMSEGLSENQSTKQQLNNSDRYIYLKSYHKYKLQSQLETKQRDWMWTNPTLQI